MIDVYKQMDNNPANVNVDGVCGNKKNLLIKMIAAEFARANRLIKSIDDDQYTHPENGTGSVGGHIRHNLDFINSFLNGIVERRIDYSRREREARVETDRYMAITRIDVTIGRLNALDTEMTEQTVIVRSEIDGDLWHASSVSRELEFVHSHTVHHHALIAGKLRGMGIKLAADFGVAPSTLKFWAESSDLQP